MVRLLLQLLGAMTRAELLQLSRRFVLTSRFYSKQTEVQQGMHRPGRVLPSAGPALHDDHAVCCASLPPTVKDPHLAFWPRAPWAHVCILWR